MIDASSPDGDHMSMKTFEKAIEFAFNCGVLGILLSGGEPFEHPDLEKMVDIASEATAVVIVASNGLFTLDPRKLELAKKLNAFIQVTNDERYYPKRIDETKIQEIPKASLEKNLTTMYDGKRAKAAGYKPTRFSPFCFNLRSLTRAQNFASAVPMLEYYGKLCSPSINADGTIVAGEVDGCYTLGDVETATVASVDKVLKTMKCNRCGLVDNLDEFHADAIGESHGR